MERTDATGRLARLDELAGLLRSRESTTSSELASELGVSLRTLYRDLAVLRNRGVSIEGDRGRGGGLRAGPGRSAGRIHLDLGDALGLLLSVAIAEKLGSPLLLESLASVRRKVAAAFSPPHARQILALRRRVLIGQKASDQVLSAYHHPGRSILSPLSDAFFGQRLATITYEDQVGRLTVRQIEAQFLYYNLPVWYVLAWDRLRGGVRFFRIDRLRKIEVENVQFRLGRAADYAAAGEADADTL